MIETERLLLRPLLLSDAERVEELAGDYEIAKTTLTIPYPYPKGAAKQFIIKMNGAEKEGKLVILAITKKEDGVFIGIINLSINIHHERGELSYWIGKEYWRRGYGTEAAKAVIKLGFEELHLNRIFAAAFTNNQGSWRIMEKIGMKHEGTLKQHVLKWGEYEDLSYYGIVNTEYFNLLK
ncbi:GNAT family N-acetyltransferase [Paenibacillus sp. BSR1-1]|uniref:GNAT family N-acetyltransferase n=1 Tax=Paenibacillus sp. BSR1-1 TaxID=3020845 RepID=UPI0025B13DFD|nr:GNAT family N-acetyltransferase [Paenibacillus sp. BSR1-1]MDN3017070.1 GNAT family N-acetyltransferase [Paenibacillus sp. BSR1-1]